MISCIPTYEPANSLSVGFWTDMTIDSSSSVLLYIDDKPIGMMTSVTGSHDCDSAEVLPFDIPFGKATTIGINYGSSETIPLATVEIFGLNTGMSIDSYSNAKIEIDGTTDDRCTQIYLSW